MPEAKNLDRHESIDFVKAHLTEANLAVFNSLPTGVARQLALDRDPHGNVQVSLIETEKLLSTMVAQKLERMKKDGKYTGKFGTQHHFFGYEGRCAAPSNFDADYCYALGTSAAQRDRWARETAYVYPGPIQYWGPTEVCDQPTKTLALEQGK